MSKLDDEIELLPISDDNIALLKGRLKELFLELMEETKRGVAVGVPVCDYPKLRQKIEEL